MRGGAGENFSIPTLSRNFFAVVAAFFILQSSRAAETSGRADWTVAAGGSFIPGENLRAER